MTERFSTVLITVDAWRADFAQSFDGVRLVPSLDAFADKTIRFEKAWSCGPWTTPGLVSLMTGEPAQHHGVHYAWSKPRVGGPSVVGALREAGFDCPNLTYLNRVDNYQHLGYDPAHSPPYPKDPEDDMLVRALAAAREPFFLWYHYKWLHLPYKADSHHREAVGLDWDALPDRVRDSVGSKFVMPRSQFTLLPEDRGAIHKMYAACVLRFDAWLARVLETLDRSPCRDRTSLVLTADHGEELMEHGHAGHASTSHEATLFEEVLRVPLIVVDPRVTAPGSIRARVQTSDLHRTLLSMSGLPEAGSGPGVDLSAGIFNGEQALKGLDRGRVFGFYSARRGYQTPRELAHHTIRAASDGHFKLISTDYGVPKAALYDLGSDPREQYPIDDPEMIEEIVEARGLG